LNPITRRLARLCCGLLLAASAAAQAQPVADKPPAKVMLLGLFHFDNPGLDAVKYTPRDVMQPAEQAYLEGLSQRLARFAPTRVLLEYPAKSDALINQRYADYRAGKFELRRNEIYQLGFRVASLAGLPRVHGFDVQTPGEVALWGYLNQVPEAGRKMMAVVAAESQRLNEMHRTLSLKDILARSNAADEDRRNKGFYMVLNDVAAAEGLFHGADASADWWQRNMRMYALIQMHAQPGERVLVIAGSGHTAILRDLLNVDAARAAEDVTPFF
jgi:hypothetical protein